MTTTPDDKRKALAEILAAHPGNNCAVQCARIRAALSRFSLTNFGAMRHLDVNAPGARVMQLRHAGESTTATWSRITTDSGHWHRVGVYMLGTGAPR